MAHSFIKRIAPIIIAAFAASALFGLAAMTIDGTMHGDCLFSPGAAACPPSPLAAVLHHADAYGSFLNVTIAVVFSLTIIALALLFALTSVSPKLLKFAPACRQRYRPPSESAALNSHIICWLSLFENSPSAR